MRRARTVLQSMLTTAAILTARLSDTKPALVLEQDYFSKHATWSTAREPITIDYGSSPTFIELKLNDELYQIGLCYCKEDSCKWKPCQAAESSVAWLHAKLQDFLQSPKPLLSLMLGLRLVIPRFGLRSFGPKVCRQDPLETFAEAEHWLNDTLGHMMADE